MRPALVFALLLLAGCAGPSTEPAAPSTSPTMRARTPQLAVDAGADPWTERAPIPVERVEIACITAGDRIYAVGGFDKAGQSLSRMDIYDLAADRWSAGPDAPVPLHHTGIVAHGNAVFLFGGYTGPLPFAGLGSVFRFDLGTRLWSVETSLPRPRGGHATIHAGNDVYLVGGSPSQPGTLYTVVDVYNLQAQQWRAGPPTRVARDHLTGGFAGGEVIAAGGREFTLNTNLRETEGLVPGANAWSDRPPMPTPRGGIASTVVDGRLYVFGGESSGGTYDDTEVYDAANQTWYEAPRMPRAVHAPCAAAAPDGIHVIAGGPEPAFTASPHHHVLDTRALRPAQ